MCLKIIRDFEIVVFKVNILHRVYQRMNKDILRRKKQQNCFFEQDQYPTKFISTHRMTSQLDKISTFSLLLITTRQYRDYCVKTGYYLLNTTK
jgi:hypothetical protein